MKMRDTVSATDADLPGSGRRKRHPGPQGPRRPQLAVRVSEQGIATIDQLAAEAGTSPGGWKVFVRTAHGEVRAGVVTGETMSDTLLTGPNVSDTLEP